MPSTVTQDYTSVSYMTGTDVEGAVLHVRRCRWTRDRELAERHLRSGERYRCRDCGECILREEVQHGDGCGRCGGKVRTEHHFLVPMSDDGRRFASVDEASAFALERGYLQEYFTSPWLRAERVERAERPLSRDLARALRGAMSDKALERATDRAIAAENRRALQS